MSNAIPFKNFSEAVNNLPRFITGLDLLFQHKDISDLAFLVQHEIDLWVDGEENTIKCKRQSDTSTRVRKCKAFIARCNATMQASA